MAEERIGPRAKNAEEGCIQEGECRPKHQGSKSTRHWCKGHEGMAHEYHWTKVIPYQHIPYRVPQGQRVPEVTHRRRIQDWVLVCSECGKVGRGKQTCADCGVPVRSSGRYRDWTVILHGVNCDFRDAMLYQWGLYSLAELEEQLASVYKTGWGRPQFYETQLSDARIALQAARRRGLRF